MSVYSQVIITHAGMALIMLMNQLAFVGLEPIIFSLYMSPTSLPFSHRGLLN